MSENNHAILVGTISEPSFKTTTNGKALCRFRIKTGEGKYAQTHNVVCWEELATMVRETFAEGHTVRVEGEIRNNKLPATEKYPEKWITEINAETVTGV